jgi:hypothetical protein
MACSAEGLGVAFAPHAANLQTEQSRQFWRGLTARRWCSASAKASRSAVVRAVLLERVHAGEPRARARTGRGQGKGRVERASARKRRYVAAPVACGGCGGCGDGPNRRCPCRQASHDATGMAVPLRMGVELCCAHAEARAWRARQGREAGRQIDRQVGRQADGEGRLLHRSERC